MVEDRGSWLGTATALFFGWAILSICVRIWVALGRKRIWASSDTGAVAATLITILHVAVNFWAISNGYGRAIRQIEDMDLVEKALYTSQLSYIGSIGMTKVSTAFFIGQLTRHPLQVRMSYILAVVSGGWTIVGILIVALRSDLSRPWAKLDGTETLYYRWIAVEAVGLVLEAALWLLSMSLVWGLQMKLQKRIFILTAFGCRLLLIPIVAVRLFFLSPGENYNPTLTSVLPSIFTEGAMNFALISTSLTSLKPFLKPFHTGAIINTVGGTRSGLHSDTLGGQGLYLLTSVTKDKKGLEATTATTVRSDSGPHDQQHRGKLYTGHAVQGTTVISSSPKPHNEDIESVESNGSERLIIRTTKDWNVRYENA